MCSFAFLVLSTRTQHCTFAVLTLATQGVQTFGFIQYTASRLHYQVKEVKNNTIITVPDFSWSAFIYFVELFKSSGVFEWKLDYFLSVNAFSEQTT